MYQRNITALLIGSRIIERESHYPLNSAGNNFSLFRGHMSFQIFLLVGHLTNWTGHNLLTDNTLKKRTQDVLVTCSVILSDHNVKLAGHFQNLFGQCLMTDCYFQLCLSHYKSHQNKQKPSCLCNLNVQRLGLLAV